MGSIVYIDLSNKDIIEKNNDSRDYGRGLIARLLRKATTSDVDRFDEDNIIVLAPGLFSGTLAPSTGRLLIATKESKDSGIQISNMAGTISQKLASFNIDAMVISGKEAGDLVTILIEKDNISLEYIADIRGLEVSPTIEKIRTLYGKDCSIIGIGPTGENLLPISSVFSTYPEGNPAFYCARNGIGDVFGSKGVKAIAVKSKAHFEAEVHDKENFRNTSKKLSRLIIDHPICGDALPGLGSITLMKMMQQGRFIKFDKSIDKKTSNNGNNIGKGINRTCSPLCVVGCLNRHAKSDEDFYSAPAESEASAALFEAFAIEDKRYVKDFTSKCFELGLDCMEFIFSCEMYFKLEGIIGSTTSLDKALDGVRNMTLIGRILGSSTKGIYELFKDKNQAKKMVSKPSIVQENNFNINISSNTIIPGLTDLDYLYAYIIAMENLGFCLFTSFAFIDSTEALDLLGQMYYYKTGLKIEPKEILQYALDTLASENQYEKEARLLGVSKAIPNFVKVLYRYFNDTN